MITLLDKLDLGVKTLSYEFFPPNSPDGWVNLYRSLADVVNDKTDLVSVTYGAGGSTREKTIDLVARVRNDLGIKVMAHLTCVGHSYDELRTILSKLQRSGVQAIMALRGDIPMAEKEFIPHLDGPHHASDLIKLIKDEFNFEVGCAAYPEKHPEAQSLDVDIEFLKLKQSKGADFAMTQLFFDNDRYFSFIEKTKAAGITIPIIPGIMPVTSLKQLDRFQQMCGCSIPNKLKEFLSTGEDVAELGARYALEQSKELLEKGAPGIHLYTLNKADVSLKISNNLF